ncbi:uncharacterized protein K489DRAFT_366620 [Dissoconium aciculare CBS 342.82]|uniref:t-SNARE coiled-coil homology domain-containing protein n=1 Tax=Dissoconium aciculare CBS 342.82 TaxID=1314786 RepID=A0A6J3MHR3_9PEZI|nr:uncharacterized protein K489DRAFT_366620 [Dissoconium aciculare CBS 342.82]KAF1827475.1 hypothetical protein K489DRAFT_366620 [Dissoconium aciculare CBS 342.82]
MASRFNNQRDSRNALFSNYDPSGSKSGSASTTPQRSSTRTAAYSTYQGGGSSPYSYGIGNDSASDIGARGPPNGGFSAYPAGNADGFGGKSKDGGFRAATPNGKGQYSSAMLDELESQNDDQASEMSKKIKMLKGLTIAIGDEIRDSTAFAEKMNDTFEGTRNRLRGTMNRMLRMAERTGVGWRVWLGFFVFVFLLFTYVWLF